MRINQNVFDGDETAATEHARQAHDLLNRAAAETERYGVHVNALLPTEVDRLVARAQAHATLALALVTTPGA